MTLLASLPPLPKDGLQPKWLGNGFRVGDDLVKVLEYSSNEQGWNDELTSFHEDTAGDNHFIDRASRNHAISQIKRFSTVAEPTILEIGCSSGFMLQRLKHEFPNANIVGADVVYQPLVQLADKIPSVPLLRFDLLNCPLPDNCIDVIVILNVLEHIEDDALAMQQLHRILKPGGIAIIEVPAGPHLYDAYDKVLKHYRRYTAKDLIAKLQHNHFQIVKNSHLGFFLYPGFAFVKKRNQKTAHDDAKLQRELTEKQIKNTGNNKLLHRLMKVELILGDYIAYPFGIRNLVTCRKQG